MTHASIKTAAFLLCFVVSSTLVLPVSVARAVIPPVKWTSVPIPQQGDAGNWVLASGSDLTCMTRAPDGTLYVHANPAATSERLFKSTDNGTSWSPTGQVTDNIVDITVAQDNPSLVYYATESSVYRSADAGRTFTPLPPNPGGAGGSNVVITSVTVASEGDRHAVFVSTRDTDSLQYGGVYTFDEGQLFSGWQDTDIGNYDVMAVEPSPNYLADPQLIAVTSTETETVVIGKMGPAPWGALSPPLIVTNVVASQATIAFPDDYRPMTDSTPFFVGINSGGGSGDVYKVLLMPGQPGFVGDLNAGESVGAASFDVSALAVSGESAAAYVVAGDSESSGILISEDGGLSWKKSTKEPTGQSVTGLIVSPDFGTSRRVYATTSGVESAFSRSESGGVEWGQTGLIDTQIFPHGMVDLAVSPRADGDLFLLTWGGDHSLWRSQNGGTNWQRVLCSALPGVDAFSQVEVSRNYDESDQAVFVAGTASGIPAIWRSIDGGDGFSRRMTPYQVDALAVADADTAFLAGYDGANGLVYSTENGGYFYSPPVFVGNQPLKSIVLSPIFEEDGAILVGNTMGRVYLSTDKGASFRQLGQSLLSSGGGSVSVCFDPDYSDNNRVYAATDTPSTASSPNRVFSFTIDKSNSWGSIDSTLPLGSIVNQVVVADDGTLYAANSRIVSASTVVGGIERALDPSSSSAVFETVIRNLEDGVTLSGLWISGNQLWSMDTTNTRLMTFVDTMTRPPVLTSPADGAGGVETSNLRLKWDGPAGATTFQWQLNDDDNFSDIPAGFDATTQSSSTRTPLLGMATDYDWRVRATRPVLSPWSVKNSFATKLGNNLIAPQLISPEAGAVGVVPEPVFQWTSLADTEAYELIVGADTSFANPVIANTGNNSVSSTAWLSNVTLAYGKTYFWKVRAIGAGSSSDWSNTGAFTVQVAPTPTPPPPSPQTIQVSAEAPNIIVNPPPPAQPLFPVWLIYAVGVLGLALVALLAAILVVLVRQRRRD